MKHTITDCLLKMLLVCLFAVPASGEAIARNVTGKITDSGSQPIPGAAVLNKSNGSGVISDLDGKFTIEVGSEDDVLEISCLGFITREIRAGGAGIF